MDCSDLSEFPHSLTRLILQHLGKAAVQADIDHC